jgi:hypothetical protein
MLLSELPTPELREMIREATNVAVRATLSRELDRRVWSPPSPEDCDDGGVRFADDEE